MGGFSNIVISLAVLFSVREDGDFSISSEHSM